MRQYADVLSSELPNDECNFLSDSRDTFHYHRVERGRKILLICCAQTTFDQWNNFRSVRPRGPDATPYAGSLRCLTLSGMRQYADVLSSALPNDECNFLSDSRDTFHYRGGERGRKILLNCCTRGMRYSNISPAL